MRPHACKCQANRAAERSPHKGLLSVLAQSLNTNHVDDIIIVCEGDEADAVVVTASLCQVQCAGFPLTLRTLRGGHYSYCLSRPGACSTERSSQKVQLAQPLGGRTGPHWGSVSGHHCAPMPHSFARDSLFSGKRKGESGHPVGKERAGL